MLGKVAQLLGKSRWQWLKIPQLVAGLVASTMHNLPLVCGLNLGVPSYLGKLPNSAEDPRLKIAKFGFLGRKILTVAGLEFVLGWLVLQP